jgi:hypothetical protein
MSASFGVPHAPPQEPFGPQAYGPPPGLAYPPGLQSNWANDCEFSPFVLEMAACLRCTERAFLGRKVLRDTYDGRA